ncbi:hypothetical protein BS78_01G231500 [Paspalum vaginatum]|nr:hypothetical protein BS78_01G231500 [Paspalum vaginatum]
MVRDNRVISTTMERTVAHHLHWAAGFPGATIACPHHRRSAARMRMNAPAGSVHRSGESLPTELVEAIVTQLPDAGCVDASKGSENNREKNKHRRNRRSTRRRGYLRSFLPLICFPRESSPGRSRRISSSVVRARGLITCFE